MKSKINFLMMLHIIFLMYLCSVVSSMKETQNLNQLLIKNPKDAKNAEIDFSSLELIQTGIVNKLNKDKLKEKFDAARKLDGLRFTGAHTLFNLSLSLFLPVLNCPMDANVGEFQLKTIHWYDYSKYVTITVADVCPDIFILRYISDYLATYPLVLFHFLLTAIPALKFFNTLYCNEKWYNKRYLTSLISVFSLIGVATASDKKLGKYPLFIDLKLHTFFTGCGFGGLLLLTFYEFWDWIKNHRSEWRTHLLQIITFVGSALNFFGFAFSNLIFLGHATANPICEWMLAGSLSFIFVQGFVGRYKHLGNDALCFTNTSESGVEKGQLNKIKKKTGKILTWVVTGVAVLGASFGIANNLSGGVLFKKVFGTQQDGEYV